ncbi:hypothetical protein ACIQU4_27520 [Streptomyces sp. NPDC090741]|uniref:hypothetical protein n=1 Tax=Streptomyces sp. NPDC090741 TaxID=3365967 RepID=UPI00381EBF4A
MKTATSDTQAGPRTTGPAPGGKPIRYLITDDRRRTLATIDVTTDEPLTVAIERADEPELLYLSADLHPDGSVHVGHWPDGETWNVLLRTHGVRNQYGRGTPARPAEPLHTRDAIVRALNTARDRVRGATNDADALVRATLTLLANPDSESPNPGYQMGGNLSTAPTAPDTRTVTVRKTGDRYVSEFSALPGRTFGPWDFPEMIRDLRVSALLAPLAARDLVMDAAVYGTATTTTNP